MIPGEDMVEAQPLVQQRSEAEAGESNAVDGEASGSSRRRREAPRDANGNRVVAMRRVRRETEAEDVDEADIETERVIQVGEHIQMLCLLLSVQILYVRWSVYFFKLCFCPIFYLWEIFLWQQSVTQDA